MKKEQMHTRQPDHQQSGAITLLVTIALVLLASLASFYSTRSVLLDRLAGNNQLHTTQARLAAEAALAWARADLDKQYGAHGRGPGFWQHAAQVPCPADHAGPRWQCSSITGPVHPDMPGTALQVLALRDLLSAPHVTQLHATARLTNQAGLGQVTASVFVPTVAPAVAASLGWFHVHHARSFPAGDSDRPTGGRRLVTAQPLCWSMVAQPLLRVHQSRSVQSAQKASPAAAPLQATPCRACGCPTQTAMV